MAVVISPQTSTSEPQIERMSDLQPWRDGWDEQRRGGGCFLCQLIGTEENGWGLQVFVGTFLDAYVPKTGSITGYVVAEWNGPHVCEPTELTQAEASGDWLELLRVGRAVERSFDHVKMN